MSILHTVYSSGVEFHLENIDLEDITNRNKYALKTPTTTLPFLEIKEGNISETNSILFYIAKKYKQDLLGSNIFENAKINQWIEFATNEINHCQKSIIYPIFGWNSFCKNTFDKDSEKLKRYLNIIEKELENKNFIICDRLTLADIVLFRYLRFFMKFYFPEGIRNNKYKKITKWFENIMKTNEAIKAYGRTILCKIPNKPFIHKIINYLKVNYEKKEEFFDSKEKKEEKIITNKNFDLDEFKKGIISNKNKEEVMKKFWEEINLEEYSLWWLDYQNTDEEGKNLEYSVNIKNSFMKEMEKFRDKCFGIHGVYGSEGDYKIRGLWLWKGKDVPKEIIESDFYDRLTIRGLKCKNKEDIELVHEFWTKLNKNDKVQRRYAIDCNYLQ